MKAGRSLSSFQAAPITLPSTGKASELPTNSGSAVRVVLSLNSSNSSLLLLLSKFWLIVSYTDLASRHAKILENSFMKKVLKLFSKISEALPRSDSLRI